MKGTNYLQTHHKLSDLLASLLSGGLCNISKQKISVYFLKTGYISGWCFFLNFFAKVILKCLSMTDQTRPAQFSNLISLHGHPGQDESMLCYLCPLTVVFACKVASHYL